MPEIETDTSEIDNDDYGNTYAVRGISTSEISILPDSIGNVTCRIWFVANVYSKETGYRMNMILSIKGKGEMSAGYFRKKRLLFKLQDGNNLCLYSGDMNVSSNSDTEHGILAGYKLTKKDFEKLTNGASKIRIELPGGRYVDLPLSNNFGEKVSKSYQLIQDRIQKRDYKSFENNF
jgi:hypothetical protein